MSLPNHSIKPFLRLHLHLGIREHKEVSVETVCTIISDFGPSKQNLGKLELALSAPAAYATPAEFLIFSISPRTSSYDFRSFRRSETNEGDADPFF